MYIYIYSYRRLGGASPACPTPRNGEVELDFRFRFVRACKRGKTAHVRECLLNAGAGILKDFSSFPARF